VHPFLPPADPFPCSPLAPQELQARSEALEASLLRLNLERGALEAELARLPGSTAGRTLAERRRRAQAEARLGAVGREASAAKRELKQLGCL
jgi:hypothetical protein